MRKNPRALELPKLEKSIRQLYFDELTNVLYKGRLRVSNIDRSKAYEICSHLLP
jgi:hypothetical protein